MGFSFDSLVFTDEGLIPIHKITAESVYKTLVKITTDRDSFYCTYDQKLKTTDGFVEAVKLTVDHKLIICDNVLNLPSDKIDIDMAWFFGVASSTIFVMNNIMQFYINNLKVRDEFIKILTYLKYTSETVYPITITDRIVQSIIKSQVNNTNNINSDYIHINILQSSYEVKTAYLCGLTENISTLSSNGKYILCKSPNKYFIKTYQCLLLSCGIDSEWHSISTSVRQTCRANLHKSYVLCICNEYDKEKYYRLKYHVNQTKFADRLGIFKFKIFLPKKPPRYTCIKSIEVAKGDMTYDVNGCVNGYITDE